MTDSSSEPGEGLTDAGASGAQNAQRRRSIAEALEALADALRTASSDPPGGDAVDALLARVDEQAAVVARLASVLRSAGDSSWDHADHAAAAIVLHEVGVVCRLLRSAGSLIHRSLQDSAQHAHALHADADRMLQEIAADAEARNESG